MKEAPLSDLDINARIAMADHLDRQAQATHGISGLGHGRNSVSAAALGSDAK